MGEKIKQVPKAFPSDVQGSYTGRAENPYEEPIQDADDL